MHDIQFKAIGTQWCISCDGEMSPGDALREQITEHIGEFERRFSRFLNDSEVNAFRDARAGTYPISDEFAILLRVADRLRELTDGVYDPAAGGLLEAAGYDAAYSMTPRKETETFELPHWELRGTRLTINGPITFDLGGIGKGYAIDMVVALLRDREYRHFIVDAGGDMYGTSKADGTPYRVAIQYPGKSDTAAGVVELRDRALAVSDSFRRRWGAWHHVVDPYQRKAIETTIGAAALAPNAWFADCMTSGLFLAAREQYGRIAQEFESAYLVFADDGTCIVSNNWDGELF